MLMKQLSVVFALPILSAMLPGCGTSPVPSPSAAMTATSHSDAVPIADLPKPVVDAVQKEMPGAVLTKAKRQTDGNYHLSDVKVGKEEYTLTVSPDGTILKKEDDDD